MSSHTSRAQTKARRYLPSIPFEGDGVKRTVTFNKETIETSIGGTQTPGRIKGDPLSPMKRLINDDCSLRSDSLEGGVNDSNNSLGFSASLSLSSNRMSNSFNTSDQDVSIEVSVTEEMTNGETAKVNLPSGSAFMNGNITTPVRNAHIFNGQREETTLDRNLENLQLFEPGLTMKIRTPTTLRRHTLDEKLLGTPECYSYVQLDKPKYELAYNDLYGNEGADSCSVTVAVRVRPFSQR